MADMEKTDGLTQKLAQFYTRLDYEMLPPQVVDRAKYFCLDFLGVGLLGSRTLSSAAMIRTVKRLSQNGTSIVMGTDLRTMPQYAALANGTSAHSLELDDVSNDASLHPGVFTFPTAFSCADLAHVDGRSFISAVVTGYDLAIRLGRALDPQEHYARGFHPTGTCGTFAAALVTSRLLGLDEERTTWALGIAGSQAAGSMEFLAHEAWSKRFHPGWAAHSGIIAALLAREGFTGPPTIFEGRDGFLHGYSGASDAAKALERLGEDFYITKSGIKPHACCRYKQGPIDCLLQIAEKNDLQPDQVAKVTVGVLKAGYNIIASPEEQKRNPQSVTGAQFSMPFGAAIALIYRRASLDEYTEENLHLPEVKRLMSVTQCVQDPALELNFPSQWPAWAEVEIKDGRVLKTRLEHPKGDPYNPLSWDELKDKFRLLTQSVISTETQEAIIRTVEQLEDLEDVRELGQLTAM